MGDWKMTPMTDFAPFPDQEDSRRAVVTRASDIPPGAVEGDPARRHGCRR